jgi:hypothetical protein
MVYPNGGDVRHADGEGRSNSGVAGYDAVSSIDQNRIDEAKLSDAGCNLFDLSGRVTEPQPKTIASLRDDQKSA